ncbi:hypothetical protein ACIRPK_27895 [Kitasatospora sp. NPDC101801]|uniref:hypothetical protein n=1 Tax=Kitasatospora sp. NPDC101801 TaxID=3364103 RepID=UPI00381364A5
MTTTRNGNSKPKNLTCDRCKASVQAVHVGTVQREGEQQDRWAAGPCTNPQCSRAQEARRRE